MKPLQNAYEKVKGSVSSSYETGLNLIKKAGFGTLVLATLASCQKDDVEPISENQNPTVEANLDKVDSTSADVFVNFEDVDGEVVSGTYYLTRFNPVAKIMGDTPFTAEQIKAGNLDGFNLKFDNLQPDTDYKLVIEAVTDNEGAEAQTVEIEFKTEKGADNQEPNLEYKVDTEINNVISWDDAINGMVIPQGTVLGEFSTDTEVKKDGVVDSSIPTNVEQSYEGEFPNDIEIQGNQFVTNKDIYVDKINLDGTTNTTVADGIKLKLKTVLTHNGEEKAQDTDESDVHVEDKATVSYFENPQGGQILVENINGDLFQDYVDAGNMYDDVDDLGISIYHQNQYQQIANSSEGRFTYQPVGGYPDIQFTSGIHVGKSLHMEKLQKVKQVLNDKLVENGITIDGVSLNHNIFGMIISQLSDNDFEDYNGTSVQIKDEVIDKVCGTIVVARLNEMGVTVE